MLAANAESNLGCAAGCGLTGSELGVPQFIKDGMEGDLTVCKKMLNSAAHCE